MPVNFDNVHFNAFATFAQQRVDAGEGKAVISASVTKPLDGRKILNVATTNRDFVHKWSRDETDWEVNDRTRSLFKQAVARVFGGEDRIPESVRKVMIMDDYNQGKPLTARRIVMVKEAIDRIAGDFSAKVDAAKAGAVNAYGKVNENDPDADPDAPVVTRIGVDHLVETAMKAVGTDPDALDILTARGVMDGLLIRGDATLRAPAEVAAKAEGILLNVAELKQAAKGDPAILAAGKIFLAQLGGKSVPDGLITAMVRDARNADVSAIKRLTGSSSGRSIHKALNQYVAHQVRIAVSSGAERKLSGPDEKSAGRDFVGLLLLAKCGRSPLRKIQAALHSGNAQKLSRIYTMMHNGNFDKDGLSDATAKQACIMGARSKSLLGQMKIAADSMMGVPDAQIEPLEDYEGDIDFDAFRADRISTDLINASQTEAVRCHDEFLKVAVRGDSEGATALRKVYAHRIGPESFEPKNLIDNAARRNASAMLNWTIADECRKMARGDWEKTTFSLDLKRMEGALKLGDVVLSTDFRTARNQVAAFVTKGAKTDYGTLTDLERGKAHVVMALLSQETGKAGFDGQFQALDPLNARPPVVTLSDQEADTRNITLSFDETGRLTMQFDGVQNLTVLQTDPGNGKTVTTMVGAGSTAESHLTLEINATELDRLASLDYTRFDDTAAKAVMADKTATNKLPAVQNTFAPEYRFVDNAINIRLGLQCSVK
jgi:hypothetical protein